MNLFDFGKSMLNVFSTRVTFYQAFYRLYDVPDSKTSMTYNPATIV